jgi:hypothetical protein
MQAGPDDYSSRRRGIENDENNELISGTNDWISSGIPNGPSNASHGHGRYSTSDISNNSRLFSTANDTTNVTSFELLEDEDDKRNNDGDFATARRMPTFMNETAQHSCKCTKWDPGASSIS